MERFERVLVSQLLQRLGEPRGFIQVIVGARQTGKTTALKQLISHLTEPVLYASADDLVTQSRAWLQAQWDLARATVHREGSCILFIDEIQQVQQWSALVKALWDEDSFNDLPLKVVLTGSSTLLLQTGLAEALTGRYELLHSPHWSFAECREAFGYSLEQFLSLGGYPGAARLANDFERWRTYINESIIQPTITKDILALERVHKPALLSSLFYLGAQYSSKELSYRKLMGQLNDAGNATTLAHYLDLLGRADILAALPKYYGKQLNSRNSTPRLMVYDTALMVAAYGAQAKQLLEASDMRGHLIETAVGAYVLNRAKSEGFAVFWWREGSQEIDFVLQQGDALTVVEVKSGLTKGLGGFTAFASKHTPSKQIVVGSAATSLEAFLLGEVALF